MENSRIKRAKLPDIECKTEKTLEERVADLEAKLVENKVETTPQPKLPKLPKLPQKLNFGIIVKAIILIAILYVVVLFVQVNCLGMAIRF